MTQEELLEIIIQAKRSGWVRLDLSSQGISELPNEIIGLTNLRVLHLDNNRLSSLPESIGRLTNLQKLDLAFNRFNSLPESIGRLAILQELYLRHNQLSSLPGSIGQLTNLQNLDLEGNQLNTLPESIGQLTNLQNIDLRRNVLNTLPESIGQLANLKGLHLAGNRISSLPESIIQLNSLQWLYLDWNQLNSLPESIGRLTNLQRLGLTGNRLNSLPESIGRLINLQELKLGDNQFNSWPESIVQLTNLQNLDISGNQMNTLPESIGQLTNLQVLDLNRNELKSLPVSLARLETLWILGLYKDSLYPALKSAYEAGLDELRSYLRSLEEEEKREKLYEAKLVLIGEGNVGKTSLLKVLRGLEPVKNEPTTHGSEIVFQALSLPHPGKDDVDIKFNTWDFGGQEVYRVTHQFFFSPRSVYLLVWEPRLGVQQCQVEDWLKLIRLRVGDNARVIIVSTHCRTGGRIARIDQPVMRRDYGSMIVGFHEVDSFVDDPVTGEKTGITRLKQMIAEAAKGLDQMGMLFNRDWREARDELLKIEEPYISYNKFAAVCKRRGLDDKAIKTLAYLTHDLGYIVFYGDDDRLNKSVVLKPEWLTKAIGFVLEDRTTQEMDGILPDSRLKQVWLEHSYDKEPRYEPTLYRFFLRLMEKYDVSYRPKEGGVSLIAQHVPQVRPVLPWLPEKAPEPGRRRIAMVCVMEDTPPGLVPWMIVRTHQYAYQIGDTDGKGHRLHWQKGMFLRDEKRRNEAFLELRGREFHIYAEAAWPRYFMNIISGTIRKLITDNWPGLKGRYEFAVPCEERLNGEPCSGRFNITALRRFHKDGDKFVRCQVCFSRHKISDLLYGFEEEDVRRQFDQIKDQLTRTENKIDLRFDGVERKLDLGFDEVLGGIEGVKSILADYVMNILRAIATEFKEGPRLFTISPVDGIWYRFFDTRYLVHLWCEADGCQHPVTEDDKGIYEFEASREWVKAIAPYAGFIGGALRTLLPVVGPAVDAFFGPNTIADLGIKAELDLMKELSKELLRGEMEISEPGLKEQGIMSDAERSGVLALHALLREKDPTHKNLGLKRHATYTGDYLWLCPRHYEELQSKIPDKIE
ncbi:MAG: leucine-rich repeat domain-containing protein [Deltaproteobacteria bacterium]|nr:leucine-rich repeat domain-containing protein [Deltaproteobacteria bacterium]